MAKFSDRMGITHPPKEFQLDSMTKELRNSLWNIIVLYNPISYMQGSFFKLLKALCIVFLKIPLTDLPEDEIRCRSYLEKIFMDLEWYDVYNIMERIVEYKRDSSKEHVINAINMVLKNEFAGYTFTNGEFIPITNSEEIESLHEALTVTANKGLNSISEHIKKASSLLSKKPDPDYHNSIKESISAVEGICKILTGNKSGGITGALTVLSKKSKMHPSLREGYIKIYGYTSDEGGIRHPMLEDSGVGFTEAKYMLVSCSAFINYITDKAIESKLI